MTGHGDSETSQARVEKSRESKSENITNRGNNDILQQQASENTGRPKSALHPFGGKVSSQIRDVMRFSSSSSSGRFEGPSERKARRLTSDSIAQTGIPNFEALRANQEPIPEDFSRKGGKIEEVKATESWEKETVQQSWSQLQKETPGTQRWKDQSADLLVEYHKALEEDGTHQPEIIRHLDILHDALKGGGAIYSEVRKAKQEGKENK